MSQQQQWLSICDTMLRNDSIGPREPLSRHQRDVVDERYRHCSRCVSSEQLDWAIVVIRSLQQSSQLFCVREHREPVDGRSKSLANLVYSVPMQLSGCSRQTGRIISLIELMRERHSLVHHGASSWCKLDRDAGHCQLMFVVMALVPVTQYRR